MTTPRQQPAAHAAAQKLVILTRPVRGKASEVTRRGTVGRNDPCPCGSGKKVKRCCAGKR